MSDEAFELLALRFVQGPLQDVTPIERILKRVAEAEAIAADQRKKEIAKGHLFEIDGKTWRVRDIARTAGGNRRRRVLVGSPEADGREFSRIDGSYLRTYWFRADEERQLVETDVRRQFGAAR